MKLYDVEQSAQTNISDSGQIEDDKPMFDKSGFGKRMQKSRTLIAEPFLEHPLEWLAP